MPETAPSRSPTRPASSPSRSPMPASAIVLAAFLLLLPVATGAAPEAEPFRLLEPGLELAELTMPVPSSIGDSRLLVLRIDPEHFALRLLNASATAQKEGRSAREWCAAAGLSAAINASMYQTDLLT